MSQTVNTVGIFSTPFSVVTLEHAWNDALRETLAKRYAKAMAAQEGVKPGLCYESADDLWVGAEPAVAELARAMMAGMSDMVAQITEQPADILPRLRIESRASFVRIDQHGWLSARLQRNTAWVAVYCVAAPSQLGARHDDGVLRLYEHRLGTMFADATHSDLMLPYRHGHVTWKPVVGQMAVFPGSVTHEIATVRSAGPVVLVAAKVRYVGEQQTGVAWW
jgi:hypothetical protein